MSSFIQKVEIQLVEALVRQKKKLMRAVAAGLTAVFVPLIGALLITDLCAA